jgi:hypothetical protein
MLQTDQELRAYFHNLRLLKRPGAAEPLGVTRERVLQVADAADLGRVLAMLDGAAAGG